MPKRNRLHRSLSDLPQYDKSGATYTYTQGTVTYRKTSLNMSNFFNKVRDVTISDALKNRNKEEEGVCGKIFKCLSPG